MDWSLVGLMRNRYPFTRPIERWRSTEMPSGLKRRLREPLLDFRLIGIAVFSRQPHNKKS